MHYGVLAGVGLVLSPAVLVGGLNYQVTPHPEACQEVRLGYSALAKEVDYYQEVQSGACAFQVRSAGERTLYFGVV